jgi:hypothetical protein
MKTFSHFHRFYQKLCAVLKGFQKLLVANMNEFPKAAEVTIFFTDFLILFAAASQKPLDVAISGFRNHVVTALAMFVIIFNL